MVIFLDLVKTNKIINKSPTGKVKKRKLTGIRIKWSKSIPPVACLCAKTKRIERPSIPNDWKAKYRFRKVGIKPKKNPVQKIVL